MLHEHPEEVKWHEVAPVGKMDLIVDLNFRMDSSALYSDIVLPAASWYEKADMNSTDLHSFIHPLSAAVAPVWESKSDWEIFKALAHATAEMAKKKMPGKHKDVVAIAAEPRHRWTRSRSRRSRTGTSASARPSRARRCTSSASSSATSPSSTSKFITFGEGVKKSGLGGHGNHYMCEDAYDEMLASKHFPKETMDGKVYPSLKEDTHAANVLLHMSTLTNGKLNVRAYENMEKKTGLAAGGPRRGQQGLPHHLRGSPGPTPALQHLAALERPDERRPRLQPPTPTTSSGWCPGAR